MQTASPSSAAPSRRRFIKAASAAVAAPYFVPPSVFGATAPSNRITIGCIGVGNKGFPIMESFLNDPRAQVVAVCDVNRGSHGYRDEKQFLGREPARERVESFYASKTGRGGQRCDAYNDFREVLARGDIQAVTVCTPDHWHAPITVAAADGGKDIYCEKPLSLTINDGKRMVDAVRRNQRVLQTGSHERSSPVSRQACELVRNGYIGRVKRVLTQVGEHNKVGPGPGWQPMSVPDGFDYDMWLGPAPMAPYHKDRCLYRFRFNYDYSGGQVTNFGAHSLDMAQWGLGRDGSGPVEVEYVDAEFLPEGSLFNAATHTTFRCRYEDGVELTCKTGDPAVYVEFEGEEGRVATGYGLDGVQTEPASLAAVEIPAEDQLYVSDDHVGDFLDCVRSRRDPAAPVEVGHRSATVCHLGNIAIRLKANLRWDPAAESFLGNEEANAMLDRPARGDWG